MLPVHPELSSRHYTQCVVDQLKKLGNSIGRWMSRRKDPMRIKAEFSVCGIRG